MYIKKCDIKNLTNEDNYHIIYVSIYYFNGVAYSYSRMSLLRVSCMYCIDAFK